MDILSWRRRCLRAKRCVLCHASAVSDGLCAGCAADLAQCRADSANTCPSCTQTSVGAALCGQCQQKPPPFEKLWTSVYYEPPVSAMIHAFKHQADLSMLRPLSALMLDHAPPWLEEAEIDTVLAMPLSKERRLFRGFNQTDGLAEAVGRHYSLPVLSCHVVFRRPHAPQSTLKRDERKKNVKNAFVINNENNQQVKNRKILLVDDVVTTGATFEALAATLRRAGASAVFCWALARPQMKK
ncbi:MAG: ComF family protein [Neisseria zoodegmatis]|uniref:ComF family protein n=1 Tax=Neisseria zoodegmatis TaxID=326523 RepID=UPI0026EC5759|nr:ComF family protein [Neisseria zoodegmatis]MDO5069351.1 ComF family protein [Neisseria zoodegmatis]